MPHSPFAPLKYPIFRYLWLASLVSSIGTWMQNVGAAWLMTSLTDSHLLIALLQTASALPVVLLSLPAGAFADIVDRRKYLIVIQSFALVMGMLLAFLTWQGLMTPLLLLLLTFAVGSGMALGGPAWFAATPEMVPPKDLPEAVTLNGIGFNLARAIGPAIAGLILSFAGPAYVFLLNAVSFGVMVIPLLLWKREIPPPTLPPEQFFGSMRAGLRYVRQSIHLHRIFTHAFTFFLLASSLWALLPVVAHSQLNEDAGGYGIMLGLMGTGALIMAFLLPGLRGRLSRNQLVLSFSLLYGMACIALGQAPSLLWAALPLLAAGGSWIAVVSTLHVTTQLSLHGWVKGRALSVYLMVFQAGMALGSVGWGLMADHWQASVALVISGGGLFFASLLLFRYELPSLPEEDFIPSRHWPEVSFGAFADYYDHPVMVSIHYRVKPDQQADFLKALRKLKAVRRRDGANVWHVYRAMEDAELVVEQFGSDSLLDHMRHHERVSRADKELQEALRPFLLSPPLVLHQVELDED